MSNFIKSNIMKKLLLSLCLALGAMNVSAQIELLATVDGEVCCEYYSTEDTPQLFDIGKIPVYIASEAKVILYNEDMTLYKQIIVSSPKIIARQSIPRTGSYEINCGCFSRNIFTTDNKICFVYCGNNGGVKVYNEDGELVKDFGSNASHYSILKVNSKYKFILLENEYIDYHYVSSSKIYSLPGTGTTPIESISAPVHRTNDVQKVMEDGQIYIIMDGIKYKVDGAEAM